MVRIYGHPFAAFHWKALIALYEHDVPFEFLMIDTEHPENAEVVSRLAPTGQFPVLVDGDRTVIESTLRTDDQVASPRKQGRPDSLTECAL